MDRNGAATWVSVVVLALSWYFTHISVAPALEWRQQAKLHGDDGALGDHFGGSVSISGDTAIVGASGKNDDRGTDSGSVYVFEHGGSGWTQVAKLLPDDIAEDDRFGWNVSISGGTAIVGVNPEEEVHDDRGWAYIFHQGDGNWTQAAKLGPRAGSFGRSIGISGPSAIVGAPSPIDADDKYANAAGSAYIFQVTTSGWTELAKLLADDGQPGDYFGRTVSISGDTALVAAVGSAYIFEETPSGWTQMAKLLAEDGQTGDYFGESLSISGDTAIIGAERDDENGLNSGAAYIFQRSDLGWTEVAKLLPGDGDRGDYFGHSVSISGNRAVIGASGDDHTGFGSGAAYIFEETETGWMQIDKLVAEDPAEYHYFGGSVSIDGDTALAGAIGDSSLSPRAGAAYVFVVPEPSSVALLLAAGAGLLLFAFTRRRCGVQAARSKG